MGEFEQVNRSMWTEPGVARLGRWPRTVNAWTWANGHLTLTGIVHVAVETIAHETALTVREAASGLAGLVDAGLVFAAADERLLIVRRVDRLRVRARSKVIPGIVRELRSWAPRDELRCAFLTAHREHPALADALADLIEESETAGGIGDPEGASKPHARGIHAPVWSGSSPPATDVTDSTASRTSARERTEREVWSSFIEVAYPGVPAGRQPRFETHRHHIRDALKIAPFEEVVKAVRVVGLEPWFRENGRVEIRMALRGRSGSKETDAERIERSARRVDDLVAGNGHAPAAGAAAGTRRYG